MTDATNQTSATLPDGTVVAGRFRVVRTLIEQGSTSVYEAQDLSLGERSVALVRVDASVVDGARASWLEFGPPVAPLFDVVAVEGGAILVAPMAPGARPMSAASSMSRERRAAVLVDAYEAILRRCEVPTRWVLDGGLWWVPSGGAARSWLLPLPIADATDEAVLADDLRALARMLLGQLYGLPVDAGEAERARLPDTVRAIVLPWLDAEAPPTRASLPSAEALATALGVGATTPRVPVPVAPTSSTQGAQSRLAAARRRTRTLARREGIGFLILLVLLAIGFVSLLGTQDIEYAAVTGTEEPLLDPPIVMPDPIEHTLPAVQAATLAPETLIGNHDDARYCRTVIDSGPRPELLGCADVGVDPFDQATADDGFERSEPYVIAMDDRFGRLMRLETFDAHLQFRGYMLFRYDDEDRVVERTIYDSVGVVAERMSFDPEHNVVEWRASDGSLMEPPCAQIRYTLDDEGRFTARRCVDRFGEPVPFAAGYDVRRSEWGTRLLTERYEDTSGFPYPAFGEAARVVTRFDTFGREVERRFLNGDGAPVPDVEFGAPVVVTDWSRTAQSVHLRDERGEPVNGFDGWSTRTTSYANAGGFIERVSFTNARGEVAPVPGTRVTAIAYQTDDRGYVQTLRNLDASGALTPSRDGVAMAQYVRDAHGNILQECHYDATDPMASPLLGGAHCAQYAQNDRGWTTSVRYFDAQLAPTTHDTLGVHEVQFDYDPAGRVIAQWYLDAQGNRTSSTQQIRGMSFEYNAYGDETRFDYLWNPGVAATSIAGVSSVVLQHDAVGRETRRCFFDVEGEPAAREGVIGAGAGCIERMYDGGRIAGLCYLNAKQTPTRATIDGGRQLTAGVVGFEYDDDGTLVRQRFLDIDGEQVLHTMRCSEPSACLDESGWGWYLP